MGEMKKEELRDALLAPVVLQESDPEGLTELGERIKRLPRTPEGLFDTASVDADCFEAARWVYPVYAAFETECNRQEGYPDLLAQMRVLDEKQRAAASLEKTSLFLKTLFSVICHVTPQLYEYHRELTDMFRTDVKELIASFYDCETESFGGEEGRASGLDGDIRATISRAGAARLLLEDKYKRYGCQ